jgi:hypothetical protein
VLLPLITLLLEDPFEMVCFTLHNLIEIPFIQIPALIVFSGFQILPKKDVGIQKNKKTPFGREVSVI